MSAPVDNWAHRSANMRCRTCMWYVPKAESVLGRCRRRSPEISGWPVVVETDFCGDHKLDEAHVDRRPGPEPGPKTAEKPKDVNPTGVFGESCTCPKCSAFHYKPF